MASTVYCGVRSRTHWQRRHASYHGAAGGSASRVLTRSVKPNKFNYSPVIRVLQTHEPPPPPSPNYSNYKPGILYSSSVSAEADQGRRPSAPELPSSSWIDMYLPEEARPYAKLARLDKPIGTWLLAWPCFWSIALAASPGQLPDVKVLGVLSAWSMFTRGAACTINDILDRDFDAKVERTKTMPMANGDLNLLQGFCFLGFQLLVAQALLLPLNHYSRLLGISILPFLFLYPLMKRITYWPQAFLGLFFSWGSFLGWAAVKGGLDLAPVFPLYLSGFFWTLVYDTIYAHQDKEDDARVGVKSTALKFGDSTKEWVTGFGVACIACLALSGLNANIGWQYYAGLVAASAHLAWQIITVDLSSPADCGNKFVSNKWFGVIVFTGILLGKFSSS